MHEIPFLLEVAYQQRQVVWVERQSEAQASGVFCNKTQLTFGDGMTYNSVPFKSE